MSNLLTPSEVEDRARALGLTMTQVCKLASVAHSTFTRWKAGHTQPTIGVYQRIIDAASGQAAQRRGAA